MRKKAESAWGAIVYGAGTILFLFPPRRRPQQRFQCRPQSSNAALRSDWDNIGKDLRTVIARFSPEELCLEGRETAPICQSN